MKEEENGLEKMISENENVGGLLGRAFQRARA